MDKITFPKPLYALSRKEYASGEVVWEFIVRDNRQNSANISLTLKEEGAVDKFKLREEYLVSFERADNGE